MMRLMTNEDFPRPALLALRAAGVDVDSVREVIPAAADSAVLAHTVPRGAWLATFDRNFGELVFALKVPAPSTIPFLRQGANRPTWPAEAAVAALERPDFVKGHLGVVTDRAVRRRALPGASRS